MIKIDKDVPIPSRAGMGGQDPKYPYADMEVSDSIFIPNAGLGAAAKARGLTQVNHYGWSKKTGFTFSSRTVTESGVQGVRVWRIK